MPLVPSDQRSSTAARTSRARSSGRAAAIAATRDRRARGATASSPTEPKEREGAAAVVMRSPSAPRRGGGSDQPERSLSTRLSKLPAGSDRAPSAGAEARPMSKSSLLQYGAAGVTAAAIAFAAYAAGHARSTQPTTAAAAAPRAPAH